MNPPDGQLLPHERWYLHQSVIDSKPELVIEIGTWKGGGSTLQIASALEINHRGLLMTCEPGVEMYSIASQFYADKPHVHCLNTTSEEMIRSILSKGMVPDFMFFDGPEDEATALNDLKTLQPHLKAGAIFMMHDWDPPSIKAQLIRPYLEKNASWEIVGKLTAPESVGLVKALRL